MGRSKEYEDAYAKVETLLKEEPRARERKNKNRAIAALLRKQWPETLKDVDKEKLMAIVKRAHTLDRAWRKVTEEKPELRGSDYKRKTQEEQEVQVALGYGDYPPHIRKDIA